MYDSISKSLDLLNLTKLCQYKLQSNIPQVKFSYNEIILYYKFDYLILESVYWQCLIGQHGTNPNLPFLCSSQQMSPAKT